MNSKRFSRRTALRGMGAAVALPLLEIMKPAQAAAQAALVTGLPPVRMAFLFVPNGAIMPHWTPNQDGRDFEFPQTLQPLEAHRKDLLVLSGLAHDKARSNGDGPGDHARSAAAFLTASQPVKTAGRDISVGVSVDQLAAQHVGGQTRLPSLELGTDRSAQAGSCDSGYSCAYSSNISWSSPQMPVAKEINPRAVFTRLFGDPEQLASARDKAKQIARRRSILDIVSEDADRLRKRLGAADQVKVDEYLDSVRSIEQRLQATESNDPVELPPDTVYPQGIPRDTAEHIRLMMDMLVLALQTDSTRIATFMYANEGSNRSFPEFGVRKGHHELSHHGNNPEKIAQIAQIDRYYVEQYAYLLDRLSKTKEGDGRLIDNCMIVYGSAIADGNRHRHHDLPVVMAGKAGGVLDTGRHIQYNHDTPMANLFLNMLDYMGVPTQERIGDSTGRLPQLTT